MHNFVQRIVRGVIFCSVSIAIAACAGNDLADSELVPKKPVVKSETGLPRIDAIRLRVARNALENKDYNTAIRFFESVRNSSPDHPAAILGMARAQMAAGRSEQAILAYRDVLELDSDHEEALDGIGRALVLNGNYPAAIKFFNRLLAKAPSAELHNRLGVAHDLMGDGAGAQKHYRAALALDPEAISPRNNLALSLAISENYEEAIKHMERVAAHPQATGKHRQNLSFVYGMAGENNAAAAAYSESGLTRSEIAKKRALYKRLRELAREGRHAEILEYLRSGKGPDGPMVAHSMADPAGSSAAMASAGPDMDPSIAGAAPRGEVMPPKALINKKTMPKKAAPSATTRTARLTDPVRRTPKKAGPAGTTRSGPARQGIYRVQLAAYRTVRTAARGVKILQSLLKDVTNEFGILVKQNRSADNRAIDYRIRTVPIPSQDTAGTLCSKVRSAGHPDCLVILHNPRVWAAVDQPGSSSVAGSARMPEFTGQGAWRLQLASYRTERGAARGQAILKKLLGNRTVNLDILVKRTKSDDPSAFNYQVRTGPVKSRAEGAILCEALKTAGHRGCLAVRHSDRVWKNVAEATEHDKASLAGRTAGSQADSDSMASNGPKVALPALQVLKLSTESPVTDAESWRLQLASYRTEKGAAKGAAVLRKMVGDRAVSLDVLVKRTKTAGPAAFNYQIRSGPIKSRAESSKLCESLKMAGHTGCLVVRHNDRVWKHLAQAAERQKVSKDPPRDSTKQRQVKQRQVKQGQVKESLKHKGRIKQSLNQKGQAKQSSTQQLVSASSLAAEASYRLQLASYRTKSGAAKGQAIIKKMLGDRPVSLDILVRRGKSAGTAAFDYHIRTRPLKSLSEGADLCEVLKNAGHQGCFVVQHNDHLWTKPAETGGREKASLVVPQGNRHVGIMTVAADPALPVIELPSSIVMETGHTDAMESGGTAINPAIPAAIPTLTTMADI